MNVLTPVITHDLATLRKTKGSKEKANVLKLVTPVTVALLALALDPFKHFGCKKLPNEPIVGGGYNWSDILSLLNNGAYTSTKQLFDMPLDQPAIDIINMVLTKHMNVGVGEKTFLKAYPRSFVTFSVMLASADTKKAWDRFEYGQPVFVEPKIDGVRAVIMVNAFGTITVLSRSGKEILNVDERVLEELSYFKGFVFDGEVLYENDFNQTNGLTRDKNTSKRLSFYAFDVIGLSRFKHDAAVVPLQQRRLALRDFGLKHVKLVDSYLIEYDKRIIDEMFVEHTNMGYEGIVVKAVESLYERKRSKNWVKRKFEDTVDVAVTGYVAGTGKYKNTLGAVAITSERGVIATVGGGFTDNEREFLWENKPKNLMIEIKHNGITKNGVYRHPRFIRIRYDKMENGI